MDHLNPEMPSPATLADCEATLQEWDRLAVRDYWDGVIAEELGAPLSRVAEPDNAASPSDSTAGRPALHLVNSPQPPRVELPSAFDEAA